MIQKLAISGTSDHKKVPDEPHTMHIHQENMIRSKWGILLHGGDNVRCL